MGIYGAGKAFNLRYAHRQAIPQYNNKRPVQQQIFVGGHQHCAPNQTKVEISYGPKGFWGFMAGFMNGGGLGAVFNFIGSLFGLGKSNMQPSPYAALNQAQTLQQPGQNPGGMDELSKLRQMFPKHTFIPEGDGKYRARDEAGKIHGPATYDEMYSLLQQASTEKAPQTNENKQEQIQAPQQQQQQQQPQVRQKDENPVQQQDKNKKQPVTSAQPQDNNKQIDKTKPIRLNMTIARSNASGATTVTVVTPDGKTYKESLGTNADMRASINTLGNRIISRLKSAGWTNVTLENKNFNWSSDGTKAEGKVDKPQTKEYTAQEKAKPIKLTILFAVRSGGGVGNSGSATVTTPDGKVHQVTTGVSRTATRARRDLANKMQERLKSAGWTNVTLENKNFNDWQS